MKPSKIPIRRKNEIALSDALMSGFAMFSLKDPSLLEFDRRRVAEEHNLKTIYKMEKIPCDTQMRTRLDEVDPDSLRPVYAEVFRKAQRGRQFTKNNLPTVLQKMNILR